MYVHIEDLLNKCRNLACSFYEWNNVINALVQIEVEIHSLNNKWNQRESTLFEDQMEHYIIAWKVGWLGHGGTINQIADIWITI